jgi:hypothetical protein
VSLKIIFQLTTFKMTFRDRNFDARRRIRHIRANEALDPSSLVAQTMREKCLLVLGSQITINIII